MIAYARGRLAALLIGLALRHIAPAGTTLAAVPVRRATTDAPPPREAGGTPPKRAVLPPELLVPGPVRVARAVATSRAMVQAANALAAACDDAPDSLMVSAGYPDGLSVLLSMQLLGPGEEVADDDG